METALGENSADDTELGIVGMGPVAQGTVAATVAFVACASGGPV